MYIFFQISTHDKSELDDSLQNMIIGEAYTFTNLKVDSGDNGLSLYIKPYTTVELVRFSLLSYSLFIFIVWIS